MALKDGRPQPDAQADTPFDLNLLRDEIGKLLIDAVSCIPATRVSDLAGDWLRRLDRSSISQMEEAGLMAEALGMATTIALFSPSAGGTTALDRLARRGNAMTPRVATVLAVLRQAQFRLLRVESIGDDGTAELRDLASDATVGIHEEAIRDELIGLHLAAWVAPLPDGQHAFVGEATPLDEAGLAVAMGFVRPNKAGLVNAQRCAEAVYRHVLRHGTPRIAGLNDPLLPDDDELDDEADELDQLAGEWAEDGAERDPDDVQFVRDETNLDAILAMLSSAANTREHGLAALSDAYAAIAQIQMETVQRRAAANSGTLRLQTVEAAVEAGIATGELPPAARDIFAAVRRRLGLATAARSESANKDVELEKLIGRIQALRAKTVEHGCTEQEALAAAEKVAELLDRYGLSLSELDLSRQSCEGLTIETDRKRTGPIDHCAPATAAFFDCRIWIEKTVAGTMRYVFFGLPADVAAARYLYDLVDQAFTRETALFRDGKTYAALSGSSRRTATNSFQIGLARGIIAKLDDLRAAREVALRNSSGRDLVVAKADIVDAEMAALGLHLRVQSRSGSRRIMKDAFDQGHAAGLEFEHTPGIGNRR